MKGLLQRLGLVAPPPGDNAYHAFISYSHAVDGELAPALQRGLQRFAKPWYRPRALRIFRDEASLSANPGLWTSIQDALDRSAFFILLASPGAAASPWVGREAQHWHATKSMRNLLVALTDGEIHWDDAAGDFDWDRTTALPETLRGTFDEEPRFIDLSWAHASEHVSLSDARFRDSVAELAAPLHGVPKDELAGEEVRQHRQTVRIARLAAGALTVLTLAAIVFGAFAYVQRNQAREQRDIATARALSATAAANLGSRIDRAALLSLEAYRVRPSLETRSGLIRAVQRTQSMIGFLHAGQTVERVAVAPGQDRLAAAGTESVTVWTLSGERQLEAVLPIRAAKALAFSQDGSTLAVGGSRGTSLWKLGSRATRTAQLPVAQAQAVAFLAQDTRVGIVGQDSYSIHDSHTGERLWHGPLGAGVSVAAFAPDRASVAMGTADELLVGGSSEDSPLRRVPADGGFSSLAVRAGGEQVAWVSLERDTVTVWDAARGIVGPHPLDELAHAIEFTPDGTLVVGLANGGTDLRTAAEYTRELVFRGPGERVFDVAAPSDQLLVSAGEQGSIVLWERASPHAQVVSTGSLIADVDYSETPDLLAVAPRVDTSTLLLEHENGGTTEHTVDTGPVEAVAVSGGRYVATAGIERVALHAPDGSSTELEPAPSTAVAFSSGDVVAWGVTGRVGLWDVEAAARLDPLVLEAENLPIDLDFDEAGDLLAVAGSRGVTLWDVESGELLDPRPLRGRAALAVALAPSGELVAAATLDRLVLYDVGDRSALTLPLPGSFAIKLSFSPDEDALAVGIARPEDEGLVLLIDPATGERLGDPFVTPSRITGIDFRFDGSSLAAGSEDGDVTIWDDVFWSDIAAMHERLCAIAGRSLTPEEWDELVPNLGHRETCP